MSAFKEYFEGHPVQYKRRSSLISSVLSFLAGIALTVSFYTLYNWSLVEEFNKTLAHYSTPGVLPPGKRLEMTLKKCNGLASLKKTIVNSIPYKETNDGRNKAGHSVQPRYRGLD